MIKKGQTTMSEDKKILSVDEMLAAPDVQFAEVEVWGGIVRLGSLSAGDMLDFIDSNEGPAKKTAGLRLIVKSLVDKDGNRIGTPAHLDGFRKKDAQITNRLVGEILKLNGMGDAARKVLGNESGEAS